jgi:hypothetical protein
VAKGHRAAGRARGGEDIQAPRPRHARVATAVAALAVAGGLAAATALREGNHELLLFLVGGAGAAALLGGLVLRWSAALAVGVAVLGAQQALRLELGSDAIDAATPLSAGALLLVAELAWWSIETRVPAWSQPWVGVLRAATVLLACAGAAVVSALVVVAAGAPVGGGTGLELMGIVAAVGALAVIAYVARRRVG